MNITSKNTISNEAIEVSSNEANEYFNLYNKMIQDAEDMEAEVIKQIEIEGYSDYYISNMGRVFSKKR